MRLLTVVRMDNEYWDPKCTRPSDLVRPVRLDPSGELGPTRGQARGPGWRRTSRGWYVAADVDPEPVEQRILEQSVRLPTCGALTGWANLRWRGGRFFDGTDDGGRVQLPVPFVLGGWADIGHDDWIAVSRERFWPHEIEVVGGVRCAIAERALFDEMRRRLPRFRPGVVSADMAFAAGLTTLDRMHAYIATRNGWTGVPGARKALGPASDGSRSPQESRMRLVWVLDAGLPAPKCNVPVIDLHGNLIGVPDLFDPVAGLVGEYDGADHRLLDRRRSDAAREERFRNHGLEYFELVRGDLANKGGVVRRMHNARRRARFDPPEQRRWTLEQPAWWLARSA